MAIDRHVRQVAGMSPEPHGGSPSVIIFDSNSKLLSMLKNDDSLINYYGKKVIPDEIYYQLVSMCEQVINDSSTYEVALHIFNQRYWRNYKSAMFQDTVY